MNTFNILNFTSFSKLKYRPDIDGLRALAVLSVLFFHADESLITGGFIGVDVFFVISGYLMSVIICRELVDGNFTFWGFYRRRILRIVPALFATLLISSFAAYFILFPADLKDYSQSVVANLFVSSNFLFWKEIDYFSPASDVKPLLHTWSLSIEEQFYIFFPLFLFIIFGFFRQQFQRNAFFALVIIFLLSLLLSIWTVTQYPTETFYFLPTRAWELILGSLAAFITISIKRQYIRESITLIGFGCIVFSMLLFDTNTTFPGLNALLPCFGAFLIILVGKGDGKKTKVADFLSFRPIVFIGLISYSLYLLHWPVIVFSKHYWISPPSVTYVFFLSIILAILSWKFIEQPFRKKHDEAVAKLFAILIIVGSGLFIFGVTGHVKNGFPQRLPDNLQFMKTSGIYELHNPDRAECFSKQSGGFLWPGEGKSLEDIKKGNICRRGDMTYDKASYILLGDSHADSIFPGVEKAAMLNHKQILFSGYTGCVPIPGVFLKRENSYKCEEYKKEWFKLILSSKEIKTVILTARWPSKIYGTAWSLGPAETKMSDEFVLRDKNRPDTQLTVAEREQIFAEKLEALISLLQKSGKNVVITGPVPETGYEIPNYVARKQIQKLSTELIINRDYFFERNGFLLNLFDRLDKLQNVKVVYPHRMLCGENATCLYENNGRPLYRDSEHLSVYGSEYVSSIFNDVFAD